MTLKNNSDVCFLPMIPGLSNLWSCLTKKRFHIQIPCHGMSLKSCKVLAGYSHSIWATTELAYLAGKALLYKGL